MNSYHHVGTFCLNMSYNRVYTQTDTAEHGMTSMHACLMCKYNLARHIARLTHQPTLLQLLPQQRVSRSASFAMHLQPICYKGPHDTQPQNTHQDTRASARVQRPCAWPVQKKCSATALWLTITHAVVQLILGPQHTPMSPAGVAVASRQCTMFEGDKSNTAPPVQTRPLYVHGNTCGWE